MKNTNIELNELEMVNGGNAYSSDLAVWWPASAQNEQQPDWMARENVRFLPEDRLLKFRGSDF